MVVTIEFKGIDKELQANLMRSIGLSAPPMVIGLRTFFQEEVENKIMRVIQSYLNRNGWHVQLHSLKLHSDDNYRYIDALRVEGTVTDYPKTIAKLMPFVKEELRKEPQKEMALELLDIIGNDLEPTLEQAALFHHAQKMTKMAEVIVRENQKKLCAHFNEWLDQNDIPGIITAICISE